MGTGISEASKRVPIFSFVTQGGKQVSSYFGQELLILQEAFFHISRKRYENNLVKWLGFPHLQDTLMGRVGLSLYHR